MESIRDPLTVEDVDALWADFTSTRSHVARDELIVHYQDLVRKTAFRMLRKLPQHFEVRDLMAYGQFGLMDAIGRFDPALGNQFSTFASVRIRGAILDELRSQDWAPRRVRATVREMETVTDILFRELGRKPDLTEVAKRIGCDEAELLAVQAEADTAVLGSLDGVSEWHETEDVGQSDYALSAEISATQDVMAAAIASLSKQDQLIVELYYIGNHKMKEIGKLLGLGESHACAAHTRAVLVLREHMSLLR